MKWGSEGGWLMIKSLSVSKNFKMKKCFFVTTAQSWAGISMSDTEFESPENALPNGVKYVAV